jgi:hypothetical protein
MSADIPTFISDVTINLTKVCKLEGGTPDKANPVLCNIPMSLTPDQASCYDGPNQAYWVPNHGCVANMVVGCVTMNTFKKWYYEGDDVFCVADFDHTECIPTKNRGGSRVEAPDSGVQSPPKILPSARPKD